MTAADHLVSATLVLLSADERCRPCSGLLRYLPLKPTIFVFDGTRDVT